MILGAVPEHPDTDTYGGLPGKDLADLSRKVRVSLGLPEEQQEDLEPDRREIFRSRAWVHKQRANPLARLDGARPRRPRMRSS